MAFTYVIFNKPYGVLSQFTDDQGRRTLKEYIPHKNVYAAGRLDMDSEGLLFLTDDASLKTELSGSGSKHYKTYLAQVEGIPSEKALSLLRNGVLIEGKKTLPAKAVLLPEPPELWERQKPVRYRKNIPTSWVELSVREGRNRQVRKMTAAAGHPCLRLVRTKIAGMSLNGLLPGQYKIIPKPL